MDFKKALIKELGVSLGLVLALAMLVIFVANDIETTENSIAAAKTARAENLKIKNNLGELSQQEKSADNYISPLKNALPGKNQLFTFQGEVKQIASADNVTADMKFIGEEEGGGVGRANFSLEVYGDYNKIIAFIKDLENSRYFIKFGNFDINTQSGVSYQAKITGKVFYK